MERLLPATALLGLVFLGLACGPSVPTEQEARAWLEADGAEIRALDGSARRYIAEEGLLLTFQEDDPNRLTKIAGRERARAGFRETAFPDMARGIDVLGADLRLIDGPEDVGNLGRSGSPTPVQGSANTRAEDGVEIDGRKLGWGVYGVDVEGGGTRDVRGYEVYWEAGVQGRMVSFRLFMPAP